MVPVLRAFLPGSPPEDRFPGKPRGMSLLRVRGAGLRDRGAAVQFRRLVRQLTNQAMAQKVGEKRVMAVGCKRSDAVVVLAVDGQEKDITPVKIFQDIRRMRYAGHGRTLLRRQGMQN